MAALEVDLVRARLFELWVRDVRGRMEAWKGAPVKAQEMEAKMDREGRGDGDKERKGEEEKKKKHRMNDLIRQPWVFGSSIREVDVMLMYYRRYIYVDDELL